MLEVRPVGRSIYEPLVLRHHYARRVPTVQHAFGLFEGDPFPECVGAVTFGPPASPQVALSCLDELRRDRILELNRLVIDSDNPNAASSLVGAALRQLGPYLVVSYADGGMGHVGYIYQATNFYYAGAATAHDTEYLVDGVKTHPRTLAARGISAPAEWALANGIERVEALPKHRYVFACGNRRERKWLLDGVLWPLSRDYPKGDTARYDAGNADRQVALF